MTGSRSDRVTRFALRTVAAALGVVYLFWNGVWLFAGKLPPSLSLALLGLPSPTTGCTRSVGCMMAGEWFTSFLYNPFTLPIIALLIGSVLYLAASALRQRRFVLHAYLGWAWLALLSAAWAFKLVSPPEYW